MQIKQIVNYLESWAHPALQEPYDNSGMILGDKNKNCKSALITLDVTEEVIDEAIAMKSNLIIAHHPLIFKGLKKIGYSHWVDKCIRKAIKHDINIYAVHTNLDNIFTGVNKKIAEKIGLTKQRILQPKPSTLVKLTVYVPKDHLGQVSAALFEAGAGNIGNYDQCSFQSEGKGTFRGNDASNPLIGTPGIRETVVEQCIEVLVKKHELSQVLFAMKNSHPYEEVAYFVNDLVNENQEIGAGIIGKLKDGMKTKTFLGHLKSSMNLHVIRHTKLTKDLISKVAICGGSGSFLLNAAIGEGADIFITSDFKYHEFFEANNQIIIADIGHYESEVFTKELLRDELSKTFAKFAFCLSKVDTNPIKYL
ncbi:MAG: Nif3-like dinuclear metal center hexameric protein [Bacteroidota bacterium]